MKKIAGRLRVDLAQYRELEAFAAFGSDLDKASKAQLERGARLVELLKQPQYTPFTLPQEVVSVWMGTTGVVDDVPVDQVRRFESELLDYLAREHPAINDAIAQTGQLEDSTVELLQQAVEAFKRQFLLTDGLTLIHDELAEIEEMTTADIEQEQVKRYPTASTASEAKAS